MLCPPLLLLLLGVYSSSSSFPNCFSPLSYWRQVKERFLRKRKEEEEFFSFSSSLIGSQEKAGSLWRMGKEIEEPFSFSSCLIGSQEKANFYKKKRERRRETFLLLLLSNWKPRESKFLLEEWGEKKGTLSPSPPLSLEAKRKQTSIRRMGRSEEKPFSLSSSLIGSQEKAGSLRRMEKEIKEPFSFSSCLIGSQEKANFH
jgi:hypothetical protein